MKALARLLFVCCTISLKVLPVTFFIWLLFAALPPTHLLNLNSQVVLILDLAPCLHQSLSFYLEPRLRLKFSLFWAGIQGSMLFPNTATEKWEENPKMARDVSVRGATAASVCLGCWEIQVSPRVLRNSNPTKAPRVKLCLIHQSSHPVLAHRSALLLRSLLFMKPPR